jgi:hypothetical protein
VKSIDRLRSVVTLLVATMCVFTLAACDVGAGGAGGGGATAGKSNAELFKEAAANMKAAKSYHMEADITQGTTKVTLNGDFDVDDNKAKITMALGEQEFHLIQVGTDAYMSLDAGKTYMKSPEGTDMNLDDLTNMWNEFKPEDIDKAKDALKDGTPPTEKIDGADTKHIVADAKDLESLSTGGDVTEGTFDIWISTDAKPTIRQMKIDAKSDGEAVKGTFKWNKIDEEFNIEAPPSNSRQNVPTDAAFIERHMCLTGY